MRPHSSDSIVAARAGGPDPRRTSPATRTPSLAPQFHFFAPPTESAPFRHSRSRSPQPDKSSAPPSTPAPPRTLNRRATLPARPRTAPGPTGPPSPASPPSRPPALRRNAARPQSSAPRFAAVPANPQSRRSEERRVGNEGGPR